MDTEYSSNASVEELRAVLDRIESRLDRVEDALRAMKVGAFGSNRDAERGRGVTSLGTSVHPVGAGPIIGR